MSLLPRWAIAPVFALGWLLSAAAVPLPAQVRDNAGFFSAGAVREADQIIRKIKADHGEDLLIETFATVPDDKIRQVEELNAGERNRFFENWAQRRAEENRVNGVYVLICKHPGHVQVEVGNKTQQKAFTLGERDELVRLILGRFKKKEYDAGLLDGAKLVQRAMDENLGRGRAAAHEEHGAAPVGIPGWLSSPWGWLCLGLGAVVVLWVVIGLFRMITGATRPPPRYDGPPTRGPGYGGTAPGAGPAPPGAYGPGYGYGGPAPAAGGGGFGGFLSGLAGGMLGGAAGSWMYDRFFHGGSSPSTGYVPPVESAPPSADSGGGGRDTSYTGAGGDFGPDTGAGSGGDFGGGGDFGDEGGSDPGTGDSAAGGDFGDTGDTGGGGDADFGGGGDFGDDQGGGDS